MRVRKKASGSTKQAATSEDTAPVREKTNEPSIGTTAARIVLLERAAGHLKQQPLADALGIVKRGLQSKIDGTRPIFGDELVLAAEALEYRARELKTLAAQLRDAAA